LTDERRGFEVALSWQGDDAVFHAVELIACRSGRSRKGIKNTSWWTGICEPKF
jgi:hypothetical protein